MDCARTLMIKKNVPSRYWKEAIRITIQTLNHVQLKKGTDKTPFQLWYDYKCNVCYFKVFGSKCYILKEERNGKFDVKGDESIFLGCLCKSKEYKCLNLSTHKVIESVHMKIDEFAERNEE